MTTVATHVLLLPLRLPHALILRLGECSEPPAQRRLGFLEPADPLDVLIREAAKLALDEERVADVRIARYRQAGGLGFWVASLGHQCRVAGSVQGGVWAEGGIAIDRFTSGDTEQFADWTGCAVVFATRDEYRLRALQVVDKRQTMRVVHGGQGTVELRAAKTGRLRPGRKSRPLEVARADVLGLRPGLHVPLTGKLVVRRGPGS